MIVIAKPKIAIPIKIKAINNSLNIIFFAKVKEIYLIMSCLLKSLFIKIFCIHNELGVELKQNNTIKKQTCKTLILQTA
jgi:hypothetical protein